MMQPYVLGLPVVTSRVAKNFPRKDAISHLISAYFKVAAVPAAAGDLRWHL